MKKDVLSKSERETMDQMVKKTKNELNKYKSVIAVTSSAVFIIIAYMTYIYWMNPNVAHLTSIIIGGQLFIVVGAAVSLKGAISSPSTIALMSMTRWDGNPSLFLGLMKSRLAAITGISFIGFGFLVQAVAMLVNEVIGI